MSPGSEAMVVLPPRTRAARMRLHRIEPNGHLTFIDPRNGGLRTVPPEAVKREIRSKPRRPS
jgi:hypothetical protein